MLLLSIKILCPGANSWFSKFWGCQQEFLTFKKSTYFDDSLCQFILIIRGFGPLLGQRRCKANFDICGSEVGLPTLTEGIIDLYLYVISNSDIGPCSLSIRHADETRRTAFIRARRSFERASGKDEEVIDKKKDVGAISGGFEFLG
jgi:hypothetical protein